jgi:hypothetical protein
MTGILRCVEVINSFDPERGSNPFGYFTTVIFNTFRQRIMKERKEHQKRDNLIMISEIFSMQEGDDNGSEIKNAVSNCLFDSNG